MITRRVFLGAGIVGAAAALQARWLVASGGGVHQQATFAVTYTDAELVRQKRLRCVPFAHSDRGLWPPTLRQARRMLDSPRHQLCHDDA
jgi:hypothetical protein